MRQLERKKIMAPSMSVPGEFLQLAEEIWTSGISKTFLDNLAGRLEETVKSPMPIGEATAIVLDPRIKFSLFDRLSERYDDEHNHYWNDLKLRVTNQLIERLAAAMQFDAQRLKASKRAAAPAAPEPTGAPAPTPAPTPEAAEPPRKKARSGLHAAMADSGSDSEDAEEEDEEETSLEHFDITAMQNVRTYLAEPRDRSPIYEGTDVDGSLHYDPAEVWLSGNAEPSGMKMKPFLDGCNKKISYLAATALAYHGGQAAAGRPERLFRDVKFLNSVLQQRMKPKTISRAAMLRESPECYKAPAKKIVKLYRAAHPDAKKRGSGKAVPDGEPDKTGP